MKKDQNQQLINRVKRIKGQVEGIGRMLDQDSACLDVVQQVLAAKNALSSLAVQVLYQESCGMKGKANFKTILEKLIKEA